MNPQDPISAVPPQAEIATEEIRAEGPNLEEPQFYFNRELSWLDFNERVLQLAEDASVPLMERLKFAAIFTSNLDEFFMIRVAGLHDQVDAGLANTGADGRTPSETIDAIHERAGELSDRHAACVATALRPALSEQGIAVVSWDALDGSQRHSLCERFRRQIFPVLTPLAVGLGRPFPYISNLSLSLAVLLRDPVTQHVTFARVKVPKEMLPRFVAWAASARSLLLFGGPALGAKLKQIGTDFDAEQLPESAHRFLFIIEQAG